MSWLMTTENKVKPCFAYAGGKTQLLKHILPLIPEHSRYVEPFAGGLAVLLAKKQCKVEAINDLSSDLTTFYRVLRFHKDALIAELATLPNSREIFDETVRTEPTTDLQRAARFFYLQTSSFQSNRKYWGRGRDRNHGLDLRRHRKLLEDVSARLQGVYIENKDWLGVSQYWDSTDTFHFFDPPYITGEASSYDAFQREDMQLLADHAKTLKGKFIITTDDSEPCREIFADFEFQQVPIRYGSKSVKGKKTPTSYELIITGLK